MTRGAQSGNRVSVVGVCHLVSCILHNDNLTTVYFDYAPSACVGHEAWRREGLAVPPDGVVRKGWADVLEFSRQVRDVRACSSRNLSKPSCIARALPNHLQQFSPSHSSALWLLF